MVGLALLMASAIAAAPADWRLIEVAGDGQSVAAVDGGSMRQRGGETWAHVAIVYREAEIEAVEMDLMVDCARGRERVRSIKLHNAAGRVFPQDASKGFQPSEPNGPWRRAFCTPVAATGIGRASLGPDFPIVAARKLLEDAPAK